MTNKEKLKVVIEQDINSSNNYNEIIKKIEKRDKMKSKNNIWKWSLVPICLVSIIGLVVVNNKTFLLSEKKSSNESSFDKDNNNTSMFYKEQPSSDETYIYKDNNIILNINKVDNVGAYKLDIDVDIIHESNYSMISYLEELSNISLPSDFDNSQYLKIFGKSCYSTEKEACSNAPYDKLINYQFIYENTKNDRSIFISFSKDNKPVRDYFFSNEGSKKSTINGTDLVIYKYEYIYFTEFVYKNIYFDIETRNITQDELSSLLQSIIK